MAISCTLTRGDYNRAWNEVMLPDDNDEEEEVRTYGIDVETEV